MKKHLHEKLLRRINEEALSMDKPFTLEDIVEAVEKEYSDYSKEKLYYLAEEILSNNDEILFRHNDDGYHLFFPIEVFFKGAEFCSTPSEEELKEAVFIPDDFFLVFAKLGLSPTSFRFLHMGKEPAAENIEITVSLSLFQAKNQFSLLKKGKQKSKKVPAINLKNFYKESGFCKGDTLIFRVEDYNKGVFSFRRKSAGERGIPRIIQKWCEILTFAFRDMFNDFGEILECRNQMEELFLINPEILRDPPISFDEFLKISPEIEIYKSPNGNFFSMKIQEEQCEDFDDIVSISSGRTKELAEILEDIGLAIFPGIIDSYIKDAISKKLTIEDLSKRLLKYALQGFVDEAQKMCFDMKIEEKWEDISERYNHSADSEKAIFRSRLLDNYDKILQIVFESEKKQMLVSEITEDEFKKIFIYISSLSMLIVSLEDEYSVFSEESINEIEDLRQSFKEIEAIAEKMLRN